VRVVRVGAGGDADLLEDSIRGDPFYAVYVDLKSKYDPNAEDLYATMVERAIGDSEVVVSTGTSVGDPVLEGVAFKRVVVDNATRFSDAAILLSLSHGAEQMVLVGDLGETYTGTGTPLTDSQDGQEGGGPPPLFQRLVDGQAVPLHVLSGRPQLD